MVMAVGGVGGAAGIQAPSAVGGKRSMAEAINTLWSHMDPAASGMVSRDQFGATLANAKAPGLLANLTPNELFDRIDREKDGQLSREEFANGIKSLLADLKAQGAGSFADALAAAGDGDLARTRGANPLPLLADRPRREDALIDLYA
ncbi:MAG: EF-hand domain-containing protein [Nitrospinae bacterium]|nr:EF-hand domain-containing protein [Nitrospinota bacterium]